MLKTLSKLKRGVPETVNIFSRMALQPTYGVNTNIRSRKFFKLDHTRIKSYKLRVFSGGEPGNDLGSRSPKNGKVWPMRLLSDKSLRNEWLGLLITVGLTNTIKFVREVAKDYTKRDTSNSSNDSLMEVNSDSLGGPGINEGLNDLYEDGQEEIPATSENNSSTEGLSIEFEGDVVENSRDVSIQKAMINKAHISMLSAPFSSEEMSQRIERNRRLRRERSSKAASARNALSLDSDFSYVDSSGGGGDDGSGGGGEGGGDGKSNRDDDHENERNRSWLFQILGLFAILSLVGVFVATKKQEEEAVHESG